MSNSKIMTYTGKWFDILDPDPESVDITDIAHALSITNRFTGHSNVPYSVAEHCVRMSRIVPPELALDALMHDCAEAYVNDINSPLKNSEEMRPFREIENRVEAVCRKALGIPGHTHDKRIKEYDMIMLVTEARDLGLAWWKWAYDVEPLKETIFPWDWLRAKTLFLIRYGELK